MGLHEIEVTKEAGMVVSEIKLTIDDLEALDEVFITSTTKEVLSVTKVDNFIIGNGKVGDTFKRIHHLFKIAIEKECLISQK
jgi:branched-subunit amino acid aminotransferase/4-amino-4-deoxychorismate lyase